ncbi:MAG: hypothetical protein ACOYJV_00365 [Aminivibrio sp.]|jgi:tetratricopeptide (TPR) repeat protein
MDVLERIEELLDEAYFTEDAQEIERLARSVLELDEDNVEALILLSDTIEYSEEKIALLERTMDIISEEAEAVLHAGEGNILEDETGMLYIAVLQRLGFALFSEGRNEEALAIARDLERYDPDGETLARTLLYRVLLDMERYSEVLEETLKDERPGLAALHGKAIASFRLSGPGKTAYRSLWEAVEGGPDIPFYILGFMPEPEEDLNDEQEEYHFAFLFEDAWSMDNDLVKWLTRAAILLGLTASLFPDEDVDNMMVLADALEIADFVEEAIIQAESNPDWGALSPHEKTETAIKMFSKGVFLPLAD